ncbi:hypothetical protein GOP47_0008653 [Adiantum capillus-veneris]|uniref:Protein kinase domain-containing protein n=1 Tax=Adiantum capillus-veneris TaxID=13818 RepID=A0A9D4UZ03_ADICA|nr:hypothetical protein GOP47_0008653 [Adiantum capillus-veneris]
MQRFCSLHILVCLAYLLLVHISSSDEVKAYALCDSNDVFKCANLGNISAPFWGDSECAASKSFVISNCSFGQASWEAFEEAVHYDDDTNLGAPKVIGINKVAANTYINLTWAPVIESTDQGKCVEPLLSKDVDLVLPDLINLATFANGSFRFSPFNYFLLFDCAGNPTEDPNLVVNSTVCAAYKDQCERDFPCVQLKPVQELALHATLDNLSCSHFVVLATGTFIMSVPLWRTATIQLIIGDPECEACSDTGGQCNFNKETSNFEQCICGPNNVSSTNCNNINSVCSSFSCNTPAIIATGVSAAVLATVAFILLLLLVYHRKKAYSTKSFTIPSSNRLLTQRAYMLSKKFGPVATKEFTFESLSKATKSFADENMIGDGGFGAVYLGILKDGREVAIKRLYHDNFKRMDHFYNEIKILSNLDHPNLVKLYGFCCQDSNDLLLVFEYAANGTVSDQLHDEKKPAMPWKTRLRIARETSEALFYLHNSVKPPIYHRDVKTTNILLDENLHVKLADFGLSRLVPLEATHVSTAPQGTPGYLDPDYHQCYQLTDKSDVYSFGVVLVELVSAKLAVDMSRDRREINLSSLAMMKIGCGMWEDLVDPRLEMKKNPEVEMMAKRVIELAFMCLHAEKDSRPTMEYVADTLSKLYQQFGYGDQHGNTFSFKVDISPTSSMDETKYLMRGKSASKSKRAANLTPTSSDWSSSNTSLSSGNGY